MWHQSHDCLKYWQHSIIKQWLYRLLHPPFLLPSKERIVFVMNTSRGEVEDLTKQLNTARRVCMCCVWAVCSICVMCVCCLYCVRACAGVYRGHCLRQFMVPLYKQDHMGSREIGFSKILYLPHQLPTSSPSTDLRWPVLRLN